MDVKKRKRPARSPSGYFKACGLSVTFASQMSANPQQGPYGSQLPTVHAADLRPLSFLVWLSYKERRVDALALRADERRDKLRKASGRSKYPLIRRYLNGETRLSKPQSLHGESIAMQGEPGELKHLSSRRKRKKHRFPK